MSSKARNFIRDAFRARSIRGLLTRILATACLAYGSHSWAALEAPPDAAERPTHVSVGILDVDAISSAEQSFTVNVFLQFRWQDPELAHHGDDHARKQLSSISAPRFLLLNRQKTWSSLLNVVDISPEGEALFRMRLWGEFSQPLQLRNFPFDEHDFEIPIVGIKTDGEGALMVADQLHPSFISENLSVPDWHITSATGEARPLELTQGEQIHGFVYTFHAVRIFNHYIIKYIIPLILIVAMSWVVFWIDPREAGSQLSVAVTAALTLIAYHIALASKLPDIPYLTRMDLFLFGSTLLVFSALLEVVLTSRMAASGNLLWARRTDIACRLLFPAAYLLIAHWSLGLDNMATAAVHLVQRF